MELFVNIGSSFKPDAQTAGTVQPCASTLDNPAHLAGAAAVGLATHGNVSRDTGCV